MRPISSWSAATLSRRGPQRLALELEPRAQRLVEEHAGRARLRAEDVAEQRVRRILVDRDDDVEVGRPGAAPVGFDLLLLRLLVPARVPQLHTQGETLAGQLGRDPLAFGLERLVEGVDGIVHVEVTKLARSDVHGALRAAPHEDARRRRKNLSTVLFAANR